MYLGIDINEEYTMVSYYHPSMPEPDTISTVVGSENFTIPTFLSKRKGMGQWFFGDDARSKVNADLAVPVEGMYATAVDNKSMLLDGELYQARDLMVIFFKKLFAIPGHFYVNAPIERLAIIVESVTQEIVELFAYMADKLQIAQEKVMLLDRRESFYYYALNQDPAIFLHDVMLFDYTTEELRSCRLSRNRKTVPQVISLDESVHGKLTDNRDVQFRIIAEKLFSEQQISSVYLIGDGFDGDWMKSSLTFICRNRRVFLGKNMYSKGGCYAGMVRDGKKDWPYVFIGDNELKLNLSIKVSDRNEMRFVTLIEAGESWFDSFGECEVILDGSEDVAFWIQRPESREAVMQVLSLSDLPERENRTTRIRISAKPVSDREVAIEIRDLGFGELVPSSNKIWSHTISVM